MYPFGTGTVVWGRISGWPWWPAVVVERASAEEHMSEKLLSELPKPSPLNRTLKFFNYDDCYEVVATKNIRDFIKEFNHVTFRKIRNYKDKLDIEIVDKAAEIALHWIVQNGNEPQHRALTGNALVEVQSLCRKRRILFPEIHQHTQHQQHPQIPQTAPTSLARSFISPPRTHPRTSRNSAGHSSIRPVSKTCLSTSDDVNNQDLPANGDVLTNQTVVNTHTEISSSPEKPVTVAEKSPIPQVQKEQVPELAQVLAPIPTVTSLGFVPTSSKSSDSTETPERAPERIPESKPALVPPPTNTPVPAVSNEASTTDSNDMFKQPLLDHQPPLPSPSPMRKRRRRARRLAKKPVASSCARGVMHGIQHSQFDFEENCSVDGGDGNEILASNITNNKLNKRTCSGAGASTNATLQSIKQDVERSMELLRSVIIRIEKFEQK